MQQLRDQERCFLNYRPGINRIPRFVFLQFHCLFNGIALECCLGSIFTLIPSTSLCLRNGSSLVLGFYIKEASFSTKEVFSTIFRLHVGVIIVQRKLLVAVYAVVHSIYLFRLYSSIAKNTFVCTGMVNVSFCFTHKNKKKSIHKHKPKGINVTRFCLIIDEARDCKLIFSH